MDDGIFFKNYSDVPELDFIGILSLRYEVFKLRLNWDIKTKIN